MPAPPVSSMDGQLMDRIAAGDVAAFELVYDRYHVRAYSLAHRILHDAGAAEEATQDAFVALWRTADRYDARRSSLRSWLFMQVHHRSVDLLRRARAHMTAQAWSDDVLERLAAPGDVEEQVVNHDQDAQARRLVAALSPDQRQVLELAYFDGLTQQEIAAGTGIPLGTVKSRARMGLARLREGQDAALALAC